MSIKNFDQFNLFTVQTKITGGKQEYLLRPDLGRLLNDDAKRIINEKCQKNVNIQLCVGDGLFCRGDRGEPAPDLPCHQTGCAERRAHVWHTFLHQVCRCVMNDVGELIKPDVVILLIGERPGLGRRIDERLHGLPKYGDTDADRDVVCNIFEGGGTNPLEAGAFVVQLAQNMRKSQASGVKLKLAK